MQKVFDQPSTTFAYGSGCTPAFLLKEARAGRIPYKRLQSGMYLFSAADSDLVRRLKAESIARRYARAAQQTAVAA